MAFYSWWSASILALISFSCKQTKRMVGFLHVYDLLMYLDNWDWPDALCGMDSFNRGRPTYSSTFVICFIYNHQHCLRYLWHVYLKWFVCHFQSTVLSLCWSSSNSFPHACWYLMHVCMRARSFRALQSKMLVVVTSAVAFFVVLNCNNDGCHLLVGLC